MRWFASVVLPMLLLAGCNSDPHAKLLSSVDFADSSAVSRLVHALPKADRPYFQSYMIHHLATSKAFCGEALVNEAGREPLTVGEAIALTIARDRETALANMSLKERGYSDLAIKRVRYDEAAYHLWFLQNNLAMYREGEFNSLDPDVLASMERDVAQAQTELSELEGEIARLRGASKSTDS